MKALNLYEIVNSLLNKMLDFIQIRPDLLMPDGSSQSDTPDSWSRRSSLKLEEVSWRLDLASYPFLAFIFG